jgi:hypothetical protein
VIYWGPFPALQSFHLLFLDILLLGFINLLEKMVGFYLDFLLDINMFGKLRGFSESFYGFSRSSTRNQKTHS